MQKKHESRAAGIRKTYDSVLLISAFDFLETAGLHDLSAFSPSSSS